MGAIAVVGSRYLHRAVFRRIKKQLQRTREYVGRLDCDTRQLVEALLIAEGWAEVYANGKHAP